MVKHLYIFLTSALICCAGYANENTFKEARKFQRDGKFPEAIDAYKTYLIQPIDPSDLDTKDVGLYTDALVQLMNSFQSIGKPDECIITLKDVFRQSPALQREFLRDFNSVLGYALSRTESMDEAEDMMMKALTLPLYSPTPERYFRDYAYAAAVFYSNQDYHHEVINWCQEALVQADLCKNSSGRQWVKTMLGSLYKREGDLNKAFELYQQSIAESQEINDNLGVLNSLHSLVDLFLYWDIPEYANIYASEAVRVERNMKEKNPMVSAQTYIYKGRALHQSGHLDSILFYNEQARKLCENLPYNSGMVDVELMHGIFLTEIGGDSLKNGIKELQNVTRNGTAANSAKAYHQLAQTYLKYKDNRRAELMLDSLYTLIYSNDSPDFILHIDYEPIINHYLKTGNQLKADNYIQLLIKEQKAYKDNRVNSSLVEAIVDFQTHKRVQDFKILQLEQANQRLWLIIALVMSIVIIFIVIPILFSQKKILKQTDEKVASLIKELNESNIEKQRVASEIQEFLNDKEKRQEFETLTPYILKESGETKFRQCFELLHPLFLHRLRERVPSITRREELLSMLIALKQDNKKIAELLAIAPRSVLMLRHRFRQKIGIETEYSLENFIEDTLGIQNNIK